MNTKTRTYRPLLAAATLAAAVGAAGPAAAFSRIHGSACYPENLPTNFIDYGNTNAVQRLVLACPVTDTTPQPKNSFAMIRVDVCDNSAVNQIVVRRVVISSGGVTSFGPAVVTPAALACPFTVVPPNFAAWAGVNYGYIQVILPPDEPANPPSRIIGVSMI